MSEDKTLEQQGFVKADVRADVYKPDEVGDTIEGVFLRIESREGDEGKKYDVVVIKNPEEGLFSVYPGPDVTSHIKQNVTPGKTIALVYRGTIVTRKKRNMSVWDLYVKP